MNPLAEIEGLLFISGDEGISLGDLAKVKGYLKPAILEMIDKIKKKYQQDNLKDLFIECIGGNDHE